MTLTRTLTLILLASLTYGCATVPKRVVRDSSTYTAEVLASLARQEEAAAALLDAAHLVPVEHCQATVAPALLIEATAQRQAYRALWLAGLPYPLEDGSLPDPKTPQEDPGGAAIVVDAEAYCNDVVKGAQ
jgi:hypothetical protein